MKKIITFILCILVVITMTSCTKKEDKYGTVNINYQELVDSVENKETFILEIVQTGCSNCTAFKPKFDAVLTEYKLTAKSLNLSNMSSEDYAKYKETFNVSGTPTVLFYKDGKEISILYRIVGNVNKDRIIEKLEKAGYKK